MRGMSAKLKLVSGILEIRNFAGGIGQAGNWNWL